MWRAALLIYKNFRFESAHYLPNVAEGHKCKRLHGHSFEADVFVQGQPAAEKGWVMDFASLDKACRPVIEELDHTLLNDLDGLDNPTSENIARWLWNRLSPTLPGLYKISVKETCTTGCEYFGT